MYQKINNYLYSLTRNEKLHNFLFCAIGSILLTIVILGSVTLLYSVIGIYIIPVLGGIFLKLQLGSI